MKISLFGLGRLGLPLAFYLADKGYPVVGVDKKIEIVIKANDKIAPFFEPGLQELMNRVVMFEATSDWKKSIYSSDVTIIFVGTPDEDGRPFSDKYVMEVADQIGEALKTKKSYHLIVLRSTVLPGVTRRISKKIEEISGRKLGVDFGVCINPEFLALGQVIHDIQRPEFVLIGESDKKAGEMLEDIYNDLVINNPKIIRTNFENAEVAKLMLNNFLTTKISYANLIGRACDKLGADKKVVSDIIGLDSRIGNKYLKPGMSYGGTCFPRDNKAFMHLAREFGIDISLISGVIMTNQSQEPWIVETIKKRFGSLEGKSIAILGMSFKKNTSEIMNSPSIKLKITLKSEGAKVFVHDPVCLDKFDNHANINKLEDYDIIIKAVDWDCYKDIKHKNLVIL